MLEFVINKEGLGQRLDLFLAQKISEKTRSALKNLIEEDFVSVNSRPTKACYKLKAGDRISVNLPPPQKYEAEPEDIPLDIIYEDSDLIVINKPRGLVTHPAPGNWRGTLVNALLNHCQKLAGGSDKLRPGIVHRLDKDTSGLLVVAKNDQTHANLAKQFKNRTIKKVYLALVEGELKKEKGIISACIGRSLKDRKKMAVMQGAREAVTEFKVLKHLPQHTLLELYPKTGRTHQLRVHLLYLGHPIVGDEKYGKVKSGMLLHAYKIGFIHPRTQKCIEFKAPLPDDMQHFIDKLELI